MNRCFGIEWNSLIFDGECGLIIFTNQTEYTRNDALNTGAVCVEIK